MAKFEWLTENDAKDTVTPVIIRDPRSNKVLMLKNGRTKKAVWMNEASAKRALAQIWDSCKTLSWKKTPIPEQRLLQMTIDNMETHENVDKLRELARSEWLDSFDFVPLEMSSKHFLKKQEEKGLSSTEFASQVANDAKPDNS